VRVEEVDLFVSCLTIYPFLFNYLIVRQLLAGIEHPDSRQASRSHELTDPLEAALPRIDGVKDVSAVIRSTNDARSMCDVFLSVRCKI